MATFYGDYRYNDRLPDIGPRGRAEEEAELGDILVRLEPLGGAELEAEDRITWDMLRLAVQVGIDALRLRLDEMAIDQMDGPQVWLQELLNWHPTDTPEHVRQLVARYRAFGGYMSDYFQNLRDGMRDGRTAPTIAVERVIGQLRGLLATPVDDSPLVAPLRANALVDEVRVAVREVVYPAFEEMLADYLRRHARSEPGVWSVTDGAAIYAYLARQHTTTDLVPEELHRVGQKELDKIHGEMRAIIAQRGAGNVSIAEFTERLIRDPANLPNHREELIRISEQLLDKAQAALPRAFGRLPRMGIVVKPIEDYRERDAPAAFYFQGSADGSRPGTFYINTFEPSSRPRHTLPALAFHEGVPGHHGQVAHLGGPAAGLDHCNRRARRREPCRHRQAGCAASDHHRHQE